MLRKVEGRQHLGRNFEPKEILFALQSQVAVETIVGNPQFLDGDTLHFVGRGERVRFEGVDAPEAQQCCLDAAGKQYICGQSASEALRAFVGSRTVRCKGRQRGRYGRSIAVCFDSDGTNLNEWLVSQAWALAYRRYSKRYIPQEQTALQERRGIWAGGHFSELRCPNLTDI